MNEQEFKKRFNYYINEYCTDVSPPSCEKCDGEAELADSLAGDNFCKECLEKDLRQDMDTFIIETQAIMEEK